MIKKYVKVFLQVFQKLGFSCIFQNQTKNMFNKLLCIVVIVLFTYGTSKCHGLIKKELEKQDRVREVKIRTVITIQIFTYVAYISSH